MRGGRLSATVSVAGSFNQGSVRWLALSHWIPVLAMPLLTGTLNHSVSVCQMRGLPVDYCAGTGTLVSAFNGTFTVVHVVHFRKS